MTGDRPPLAMTMGDPAGIGPELALAAWRDRSASAPFVVFAAPGVLAAAAKRAGFATPIIETDPAGAGAAFSKGLPVVPLTNAVEDAPGQPSATNAAATIELIQRAVEAVRQGEARAVVTNPIAKAMLYQAGFKYPGHTEYLGVLAEAGGAGLSGDDDLVRDAGGCPCDHSYPARRGAEGADRRAHHQESHASSITISSPASASSGRAWPSPE